MNAPDIELARCVACGWRRDPIYDNTGRQIAFACPNCQSIEETP
jgi:predicted RNA-binding Zn-ribbon protein involved in translation (DUF1610 family)